MKRKKLISAIVLLFCMLTGFGQVSKMKKMKIGIIAPLYLDSVFNNNNYRYNQNNFPKFTVPGFDFIQGAQMALDSLASMNVKTEVRMMDARSASEPVEELIRNGKLDDLDMIIGSVKEPDFPALAGFAKKKKIPFISATYPNDAGIRDNPYTVIVNPTLASHCESLFAFLLQNHGTEKIFLVRKKGSQEDKVESYFTAANKQEGKPFLKLEVIIIDSSFTPLKNKLDSNRTNVIIGGSLDEDFANRLLSSLYPGLKKYPVKLIGMPNWDDFGVIKKGKYKDLAVYLSSGYLHARTDTLSKCMQRTYLAKFGGLPSDFAYKGYETAFYFGSLLFAHGKDIFPNLNEPEIPNLPEYRFRPAEREKKSAGADYYENRHLHIIRTTNGVSSPSP